MISCVVLLAAGIFLLVLGAMRRAERPCSVICLSALLAAGGLGLLTESATRDSSHAAADAAAHASVSDPSASMESPTTRELDANGISPEAGVDLLAVLLGVLFWLSALGRSATTTPRRYGWLCLAAAGLILSVRAESLAMVWAAVELTAFAAALAIFDAGGDAGSRSMARRCLVLTTVSCAMLTIGFLCLGLLGRATTLDGLCEALSSMVDAGGASATRSVLGLVGVAFIAAGIGWRLHAAPFHWGFADIMERVPIWNGCLLAVFPRAAAFVVLMRLFLGAMAGYEGAVQTILLTLAVMSMFAGGVLGIAQTQVKRVLAYLTISQSGLILFGAAVAAFPTVLSTGETMRMNIPPGLSAAAWLLAVETIALVGLCAALGRAAAAGTEPGSLHDLAGLPGRDRLAALAAAVALFSLAGILPLIGFWSRRAVVEAALSVHVAAEHGFLPHQNIDMVQLSFLAGANWVLTSAVCLRLLFAILAESSANVPEAWRARTSRGGLIAGCLAAAILVGMSLGGNWSRRPWDRFAESVAERRGRASAPLAAERSDPVSSRTPAG